MMPGLAAIWDVLSAAGGTLALTFIVALALGINALTILFLGSSVVVLERFARAVRRPRSIAIAGLCAAPLAGALAFELIDAEALGPDVSPLGLWLRATAVAAVALVLLLAGTWVLLRRVQPARLGTASLAVLGLGYAVLVGGTDRLPYAAAPPLVAAAAALFLAFRRRRRAPEIAASRPGEAERLLRVLTLSLLPGIALALIVRVPQPGLSAVGAGVLALFGAVVLLGLLPLAAAGLADLRAGAEWFIAARYLVAKRRQTFISVITLICVGGVAVGVWLIITVLSVINGFERTWRDEIIGNRAHFTVHSGVGPIADYAKVLDTVSKTESVKGATPYVDAEGMVRGPGGRIVAVRLRGIDPATVGEVTKLPADIVEGSLDDLAPRPIEKKDPAEEDSPDPVPGILVGHELAGSFGLRVGDPILVVSPFGGPPTPLGPGPRLKRFRVAGVFKSSFFQWDEVFTYTDLAAAQDFKRAGDVIDGIEVRVDDFYRSQRVGSAVAEKLGFPYYARDWKEYFPSFFQALKTERVMMFVLLTMVMVVAAFVIVATLIMMIMEKSSDIAILKAMGAQDAAIERIFAIEGTLIGLVGTAVGVVMGIVVTTQLSWIQQQIEAITGIDTLPASVYQLSALPWRIDPVQIVIVAGIAMVLSLGATLLPSRQGARLDPAEGLRYE
jgi:lipoprotein-releasing system permease protein